MYKKNWTVIRAWKATSELKKNGFIVWKTHRTSNKSRTGGIVLDDEPDDQSSGYQE